MTHSRRTVQMVTLIVIVAAIMAISVASVAAGVADAGDLAQAPRYQEQTRILGDSDFRDRLWIAIAAFLLVAVVDAAVIARILQKRRQ